MAARPVRRLSPPTALPLSPVSRLEVDLVAGGVRDLVRLTLPRPQVSVVTAGLVARGLSVHRWAFDIVPQADPRLDGFSVGGRVGPADHRPDGFAVLFAARDPARLAGVDALACDNFWQGVALGYPACCVAAFCAEAGAHVRGYERWFSGTEGRLPYWTNALAEPFGHLLVSHLPCSPDCPGTRALAMGALHHLLATDPGRAARAVAGLRRVMFYSPTLGILSLAGDADGDDCALENAEATGAWRRMLRGADALSWRRDGAAARVRVPGVPEEAVARRFDFRGDGR